MYYWIIAQPASSRPQVLPELSSVSVSLWVQAITPLPHEKPLGGDILLQSQRLNLREGGLPKAANLGFKTGEGSPLLNCFMVFGHSFCPKAALLSVKQSLHLLIEAFLCRHPSQTWSDRLWNQFGKEELLNNTWTAGINWDCPGQNHSYAYLLAQNQN